MKLIERITEFAAYGLRADMIIIEHQGSRILLSKGYGGEDGIEGGDYRWAHGMAFKLHPDDTFEKLREPWNDITDHLGATLAGQCPTRPRLYWSGAKIEKIVASLWLSLIITTNGEDITIKKACTTREFPLGNVTVTQFSNRKE